MKLYRLSERGGRSLINLSHLNLELDDLTCELGVLRQTGERSPLKLYHWGQFLEMMAGDRTSFNLSQPIDHIRFTGKI